ncbi:flagellar protein FliS [Persephonella hydrogeniphila]|uniref:Flagellar protein FliS n=1 Tax=Persephonella hydrogeniphila TaxID=198703 RepID=A0A285N2S1_9AQUI|nr:flagellar export chaperone FliS [Persephonella hydrogeniphila]SNZ03742.1 flagellar protein FliS [Persephonella hydrogeniphila]
MTNPYAAYQQNLNHVDSKEDLLLTTFEEILSKLNIAKMAIDEGNIALKAENITKVTDAVLVLQASLDLENGGEIAKNLNDIYSFVLEELVKANLKNDKETIQNVIEVLTPIYEGFKEAREKLNGT